MDWYRLVRPVLGRAAGNARHVVPRLNGQGPTALEPSRHSRLTAVIRRSRQSEVAEAPNVLGEEVGGLRDGLLGIERIHKSPLGGGPRHELRDTLSPGRTDGTRPEAAFLPDEPREEGNREIVRLRRGLDHSAQRLLDGFRPGRRRCLLSGGETARQKQPDRQSDLAHGLAFLSERAPCRITIHRCKIGVSLQLESSGIAIDPRSTSDAGFSNNQEHHEPPFRSNRSRVVSSWAAMNSARSASPPARTE